MNGCGVMLGDEYEFIDRGCGGLTSGVLVESTGWVAETLVITIFKHLSFV